MIKNKCDCCGKETNNRRFCSRLCANKITNKETTKNYVDYNYKCDWAKIQQHHDNGMNQKDLCKEFGVSINVIRSAIFKGFLVKRIHKLVHTEATKRFLAEKRKQWLKENPEKHPWRKKDKFQSIPCNLLKKILAEEGLSFLTEYMPLAERFFSVDIAFPDKKIGIEVNGNQHYEKDGRLKAYYQERHDIIENNGWKLLELHYSVIYHNDIIKKLIADLKNSHCLGFVDYTFYKDVQDKIRIDHVKNKRDKKSCPKWFCKICAAPLSANIKSGLCVKCSRIKCRKVERPTKERLGELIKDNPIIKIGKMFGVSDKSIMKWCKSYGIMIDKRRGFWAKKRALAITDRPM
jgi:hypothetical protein